MQYLIFHTHQLSDMEREQSYSLLTSYPANRILLDMIKFRNPFRRETIRIGIPELWKSLDLEKDKDVFFYSFSDWPSRLSVSWNSKRGDPLLFSNASVLTSLDTTWLQSMLTSFEWDVLSIQVDPELDGGREQVKLTREGHVVGFRRQYQTSAEPDYPSGWPDHLLCQPHVQDLLKKEDGWDSYPKFLKVCDKIGARPEEAESAGSFTGDSARLYGKIHRGRNVKIESGVVIAAPAILCDDVVVGSRSTLRGILAGPAVHIAEDSRLQYQAVLSSDGQTKKTAIPFHDRRWNPAKRENSAFRYWPLFSYPRIGKRLFDLLFSLFVTILFIPFFPIITLAVKLTSSGPVFYRARRQGLHGKEFHCLKFRTMLEKAESMQEHLRMANQVDGPQFKIEDDPRISPIGKFLRETSIDELPQFLNVLAGQMSIVGPRPSPEKENEFCPAWRDARLSVRPGITGMWQVCRTREASMDFQEWIRHDTDYVRRISFRTDLWICWKTMQLLLSKFLDQFG